MKLTFQDGRVWEGLLNYEATGIIEAWVPLFVFAIMFGISFDDLTFALGRVRENHERGEDIDTAVRGGLKSVAMTILAADLILAGVVGIFAFMRLLPMQQLGIMMVVAVVLGALLVILIVMPALLRAIGDRLWYFPAQRAWVPWCPAMTQRCGRSTAPVAPVPPCLRPSARGWEWSGWRPRWTAAANAAERASPACSVPPAACSTPGQTRGLRKRPEGDSSPSG